MPHFVVGPSIVSICLTRGDQCWHGDGPVLSGGSLGLGGVELAPSGMTFDGVPRGCRRLNCGARQVNHAVT